MENKDLDQYYNPIQLFTQPTFKVCPIMFPFNRRIQVYISSAYQQMLNVTLRQLWAEI